MLIYDDTMASNAAGFKDSCILFGDYSERNDFVYTTHTSLHLCESVSKRVFDTELRTSGPYRCVLKGFNNAGANPITEKFDAPQNASDACSDAIHQSNVQWTIRRKGRRLFFLRYLVTSRNFF